MFAHIRDAFFQVVALKSALLGIAIRQLALAKECDLPKQCASILNGKVSFDFASSPSFLRIRVRFRFRSRAVCKPPFPPQRCRHRRIFGFVRAQLAKGGSWRAACNSIIAKRDTVKKRKKAARFCSDRRDCVEGAVVRRSSRRVFHVKRPPTAVWVCCACTALRHEFSCFAS